MTALNLDSNSNGDVAEGRRVLEVEAHALLELSKTLGEDFAAAIEILEETQGRIIVTGMGKSGHIGKKIAATLASTGTPAFFVHPGEASHGDLGMITHHDAVIMLSNSGETVELSDLIHYCKRLSIPLISITSGEDSTLAISSDVALILPNSPEACPMGLAPTTSTTLSLALGDAIAVTLLNRKGFSVPDFKMFHPGGKLGQQLKMVKDLMFKGTDLPLVSPQTLMADGLVTMTAKSMGCLLVVDDKQTLLGVVTDGDLRRHMAPTLLQQPVTEIMTTAPKTIGPKALAAEAVAFMNTHKITNICVVDDKGTLLGLLTMHECLKVGL